MNRPISITQPDSTVITNFYNKGGLLEQVKEGTTSYISEINYNARGQRTEVFYGNGSKTAYTYDSENFRLERLLTTRDSGNDILMDLNYTYDSVGNIIQTTNDAEREFYFDNEVVSPTATYEYDALYRLIEATGRELTSLQLPSNTDFVNNIPVPNTGTNAMQTYTQQFSYDELGNITQMKSVNDWTRDYIYDTATNQLLRHTGTTNVYTYDAHGNMLSMPHLRSMGWTHRDELMNATNGTTTSYYQYDAQGERTRKVVVKPGNIREERYYIGGYEVYRKYISSSLDTERETMHVSEDRDRFAIIDRLNIQNGTTLTTPVETIRYQYSNHLGSACLELDSTAAIISYEEYHPFGTTSYRSGRNQTDVALKRYKYVGKERDEATGLYYYGARYYAAWICRFVSVDPLNEKYPELSAYQYASNRPVTGIDLDGLEYLGIHESRIIVRGVDVHVYVENFNTYTQYLWDQRNNNETPPSGDIGFPTKIAELTPLQKDKKDYSKVSLDRGYTPDVKTDENPATIRKMGLKANGDIDNRVKGKISCPKGSIMGLAGFAFAINAINFALDTYGNYSVAEDKELIEDHKKILFTDVSKDMQIALETPGMIPDEYRNLEDLGNITNVVLMGVNTTDNPEIYEIGINIVKTISNNFREAYSTVYPSQAEGQDNVKGNPLLVRETPMLDKQTVSQIVLDFMRHGF
ncbi:MAG: RHS repeat protein [Bacteroidales bacterium]|nr:RHS repeat protein [Bacteroidales bacterium]